MKAVLILFGTIFFGGTIFSAPWKPTKTIKQIKEIHKLACEKKSEKFSKFILDYENIDEWQKEAIRDQIKSGAICAAKMEYVFLQPADNLGRLRVRNKNGVLFWSITILDGKVMISPPLLPDEPTEGNEPQVEDADMKEKNKETLDYAKKLQKIACRADAKDFVRRFHPHRQNRFDDVAYHPERIGKIWKEVSAEVKKGKESKYCKAKFEIVTDYFQVLVKFPKTDTWEFWMNEGASDDGRWFRYDVFSINP